MSAFLDESPMQQHLRLLRNLTEGGSAIIPPFQGDQLIGATDDADLKRFYQSLHDNRSADAPGRSPELEPNAAIWGGLVVHWACWAILDRSQANIALPDRLRQDRPDPSAASAHWSVDLMMAAWPDAYSRCKRASEDDPLKSTLYEIAIDWPLSAIGIGLDPDVITSSILPSDAWATLFNHPSLRRIAIDRAERVGDKAFTQSVDGH